MIIIKVLIVIVIILFISGILCHIASKKCDIRYGMITLNFNKMKQILDGTIDASETKLLIPYAIVKEVKTIVFNEFKVVVDNYVKMNGKLKLCKIITEFDNNKRIMIVQYNNVHSHYISNYGGIIIDGILYHSTIDNMNKMFEYLSSDHISDIIDYGSDEFYKDHQRFYEMIINRVGFENYINTIEIKRSCQNMIILDNDRKLHFEYKPETDVAYKMPTTLLIAMGYYKTISVMKKVMGMDDIIIAKEMANGSFRDRLVWTIEEWLFENKHNNDWVAFGIRDGALGDYLDEVISWIK